MKNYIFYFVAISALLISGCSRMAIETDAATDAGVSVADSDGLVPNNTCADVTDYDECTKRPACVGCIFAYCNALSPGAGFDCTTFNHCHESGIPKLSSCKNRAQQCAAMDVVFKEGVACDAPYPFYWNGTACVQAKSCSCTKGKDCDKLFHSEELCKTTFYDCDACRGAWLDEAGNCRKTKDPTVSSVYPDSCCATQKADRCAQLQSQYKSAVITAGRCFLNRGLAVCTHQVETAIGCNPCHTYVADVTLLLPIVKEWNALKCPIVLAQAGKLKCDNTQCPIVRGSNCTEQTNLPVGEGRCVDVL